MPDKKHNVFTYVGAINSGYKDAVNDAGFEAVYTPYVVNKAFSYYLDTIFIANELNKAQALCQNKAAHFNALAHTVRPRKRYSKWHKDEAARKRKTDVLSAYFNLSREKAKQVLDIFDDEQVEDMKTEMESNRGGLQ